MNHRLNLATSLILIVFTCLFSQSTIAQDLKELKFTTQDFRPFSYIQNNQVAGPAVEIITEVCKESQISCSFKLYPWTRAQEFVRDGSAHGMFVIGWNKKRTEWLHFSPPILNTEYGFFVHEDNPLKFKTVDDVKGYTVGVFGPSNTSRSLEKIKETIGDMRIDMTPDDESAFKKLSIGRVTAVFSNRDVGYALIKKLNLKNIRYAGQQRTLQYYIGFSKEHTDKAIVDQFNASFLKLHKKGVIQTILKKYNMDAATTKQIYAKENNVWFNKCK